MSGNFLVSGIIMLSFSVFMFFILLIIKDLPLGTNIILDNNSETSYLPITFGMLTLPIVLLVGGIVMVVLSAINRKNG